VWRGGGEQLLGGALAEEGVHLADAACRGAAACPLRRVRAVEELGRLLYTLKGITVIVG
jgi:hypothetical protein